MSKTRVDVPEETRLDVLARCNNRCCICQTPFVVIHHIDETPSNNDINNLAPLCPNCHSQAHSEAKLTVRLTAARIQMLRDRWYQYCEKRRESSTISPNAILKVKNFVRSVPLAQHGWAKTFSAIDPSYRDLTVDEIINRVFATSNRDDLTTYLETVKYMYQVSPSSDDVQRRFIGVCNAFGIDYDELG
ncbi:MAG: HNH endonuclease signature motif containing protein [Thermoanaerobaculia bacterium]